uniref:hypothetical protein n=1 Tax=Streptomyces rochei TaxID=1928 RepID=UPI0015E84612|nr:hypothetical protein [Streptomyces rochei]
MEAAVVRGALPVPLGELGQLRDDGARVARADPVEDEQQRRVRLVAVAAQDERHRRDEHRAASPG